MGLPGPTSLITTGLVEKVARAMCAVIGEDAEEIIELKWRDTKIGGEVPPPGLDWGSTVAVARRQKRRPAAASALVGHFAVAAVVSGRDVEVAFQRAVPRVSPEASPRAGSAREA